MAGTTDPGRLTTRTSDVDVPDGTTMTCYVARPRDRGPHPGVVVAPELFGVSAHVRDVCEQIAGLGYVALAPNLYHRSTDALELPEDDAGRARGFELLHEQTRDGVLRDIGSVLARLRADDSTCVAMVGLSVGGHVAYLSATEFDLPAVAVLYGGWLPTSDIPLGRPRPSLERTAGITGEVLVLVGSEDVVVPPEHRRAIADALTTAGVRHEMVVYPGVGHGYLSTRRPSHDPAAAADTWRRLETLLANVAERSTIRPPPG